MLGGKSKALNKILLNFYHIEGRKKNLRRISSQTSSNLAKISQINGNPNGSGSRHALSTSSLSHRPPASTGCPTSNLETLEAYYLKTVRLRTKLFVAMCSL